MSARPVTPVPPASAPVRRELGAPLLRERWITTGARSAPIEWSEDRYRPDTAEGGGHQYPFRPALVTAAQGSDPSPIARRAAARIRIAHRG